eukprot:1140949-Pelagomonas_calceolata.AAC.6
MFQVSSTCDSVARITVISALIDTAEQRYRVCKWRVCKAEQGCRVCKCMHVEEARGLEQGHTLFVYSTWLNSTIMGSQPHRMSSFRGQTLFVGNPVSVTHGHLL